MGSFIDLTDSRFNKILVIGLADRKDNKGRYIWRCQCDCGNIFETRPDGIKSGRTLTCGCIRKNPRPNKIVHGACSTTEYYSWSGMIARCYRKTCHKYFRYGERGIKVCDRWRYSFVNFLLDMGYKPSKTHSIERINNDGNYEPGNCKWGTIIEQANNKRNNIKIDVGGVIYSIKEFCEFLNISINRYKHLRNRMSMTIEQIIIKQKNN